MADIEASVRGTIARQLELRRADDDLKFGGFGEDELAELFIVVGGMLDREIPVKAIACVGDLIRLAKQAEAEGTVKTDPWSTILERINLAEHPRSAEIIERVKLRIAEENGFSGLNLQDIKAGDRLVQNSHVRPLAIHVLVAGLENDLGIEIPSELIGYFVSVEDVAKGVVYAMSLLPTRQPEANRINGTFGQPADRISTGCKEAQHG